MWNEHIHVSNSIAFPELTKCKYKMIHCSLCKENMQKEKEKKKKRICFTLYELRRFQIISICSSVYDSSFIHFLFKNVRFRFSSCTLFVLVVCIGDHILPGEHFFEIPAPFIANAAIVRKCHCSPPPFWTYRHRAVVNGSWSGMWGIARWSNRPAPTFSLIDSKIEHVQIVFFPPY